MSKAQPTLTGRGLVNKSSWKLVMEDVKSHNTEMAYMAYKLDLEEQKRNMSLFRGLKLKQIISNIVMDNVRNMKDEDKSITEIVKELADYSAMDNTVKRAEQEVKNYDSESANKTKINPDGISVKMHAELVYTKYLIEILVRQEIKEIERKYNTDDLVKILGFSGDSKLTMQSREIQEKASSVLYECYKTDDKVENSKKKSKLKKETRAVMKELVSVVRAKSKTAQNMNQYSKNDNQDFENR